MISFLTLKLLALGGIFSAGYKSWQRNDKTHNQSILEEQREVTQVQKQGKDSKYLGAYLSHKLESKKIQPPQELAGFVMALSLSSVGAMLYPPLAYLAIPLFIYPNRKIFTASWDLLKNRKANNNTLVAISLIGAMIKHQIFIASLLGLLLRLSDYLTSKTVHESHLQLVDTLKQAPKSVWLFKDGTEINIPFSDIKEGDILVVHAGEVIAADGHIAKGMAGIDQYRLTGESVPVEKGEGEDVFAMTLVLSGEIHILVDKAGAETTAMKITEILNHTAEYKSLTTLRAETFSSHLVYPALITAAIAWPLLGFNSAIAILFIHPKNRMSISTLISLLRHLNQASEQGILIKDGRSLELLTQVDTLVFDKTGTLTDEQPHIGAIYSLSDYHEDAILRLAAIAEYKQTHPIAQAVLAEAEKRNLSIAAPEYSEYRLGYGVKITYDNQSILVGSARFMQLEQVVVPDAYEEIQTNSKERGHGLMMVATDGELIGAMELMPTIRAEAKEVIWQLKQLKQIKQTYIISGDSEAPTRQLAHSLDIDHYFAQTLPDQKADLIKQLQAEGAFVCYIGDGINDAIAMKQAQVSVSLSGASHIATDTAQIILLNHGIRHLPLMFNKAARFHRHMNNQLGIMLCITTCGITAIFLAGWAMGSIMALNMLGLLLSLSYSFLDRPKIDRISSSPKSLVVNKSDTLYGNYQIKYSIHKALSRIYQKRRMPRLKRVRLANALMNDTE